MAVEARENVHGCVREVIGDIWTLTVLIDELSDTVEITIASSDPYVFLVLRNSHSGRRQACTNRIWEICTPEWR